jgi:hypothetical protein
MFSVSCVLFLACYVGENKKTFQEERVHLVGKYLPSLPRCTEQQALKIKSLRTITNAPWYVPNSVLHADLLITTVREEIKRHSTAHINKLLQHTNPLIPIILEETGPKRLKRYTPVDLTHRF